MAFKHLPPHTRLSKQRRARGLSQERLSYKSGVSLRTITRVEKLPAADCHVGTLRLIPELTESAGDQTHAGAR